MKLKQFRNEGCQSYIVFDAGSSAAAVIDPQLPLMADYREFIASRGLKPLYALDTHIHADHLSATHLFRAEFDAQIVMSASTRSERPNLKLEHGAKLQLGALEIEILATPGHTPDSASFVVRGKNGLGAVFTGDTLFIGGSGRTDFPGADPAAQYRSIHEVLGKLPEATLIYPGHDYGDLLFSTIGVESRRNPHWAIPSLEEFVRMKRSECIVNPESEVRKMVEFNLSTHPQGTGDSRSSPITPCGTPPEGGGDRVPSISAEKLYAKLVKPEPESALIDVREPGEYEEGHLPRAINIPLSELGFHLSELSRYQHCYVTCRSGSRSMLAARTLGYVGVSGIVNHTGGFLAWQKAGNPVEK